MIRGMKMRINKLTINNFRSYRGITNFDFRLKDDKNIILIGGENGAGKSSIFEAIRVCLYGPLTYKYQGMVNNYIYRVKAMINEDAYSDEKVEAYIELNIDMTNKGKQENYTIKRAWFFEKTKLIEEVMVEEDDRILNETDANNFMEYFKSLIPPSVFDLSFFDGEKLFEFFEEKMSGTRLKDTVLTLNNLDVFGELSRELVLNARRKNRERKNLKNEIIELETIEEELKNKRKELNEIRHLIGVDIEDIDRISTEINQKNQEFISAGGLDQHERERLVSNISRLESERERLNLIIKNFSNDMLPFLMLSDELKKVREQISEEEEFIVYKAVKDRVNIDSLSGILESKVKNEDTIGSIVEAIRNLIVPNQFDADFEAIHFLSKDQSNRVLAKINEILEIDIKDLDYFKQINDLSQQIVDDRYKLRSSMDINEEREYIKNINGLEKELDKKKARLEIAKIKKDELKNQIKLEHRKLLRINEKIDLIKKTDNVKDITDDIVKMTEDLLIRTTKNKRKDICKYFNEIFSKIIRKDIFIDYIDIDDDFNVSIYSMKNYTARELSYMTNNLGMAELKAKLGEKFIYDLVGDTAITKQGLLEKLSKVDDNVSLRLSTSIDLMKLSSGEKQIYILCLYWALIKSANISIPFVIDTPYGRIDKVHRKAITNRYLPGISHQVIILSTNTEIEETLYEEIKKYIAQEYTLDYNVGNSSTDVKVGYFCEVM